MDFKKAQPTCFTKLRGSAAEKVPGEISSLRQSRRLDGGTVSVGGRMPP